MKSEVNSLHHRKSINRLGRVKLFSGASRCGERHSWDAKCFCITNRCTFWQKKNMIGLLHSLLPGKKKVHLSAFVDTSNTTCCIRLTCIQPDIPRKTSPWGPRQLPSWDIDRLSGDAISPTNGDWRQQDTQLHDWQGCGQDPSLTSQSESVGSQTILCLRNLVIQRKQKMFLPENGGLQEQDCWILLVWFWIHKANFRVKLSDYAQTKDSQGHPAKKQKETWAIMVPLKLDKTQHCANSDWFLFTFRQLFLEEAEALKNIRVLKQSTLSTI